MKTKQLANLNAKKYIESVFEKRLIEEGFVCPNEKKLCWYRVADYGIINSIIFYSPWDKLPVFLSIGYGFYPMFQKPPYTTSVNYSQHPISETFTNQPLVEDCPINSLAYTRYSDDIEVDAPGIGGKGVFTFDGIILPKFNSVKTVEDCYMRHKQDLLSRNDPNQMMNIFYSALFIDEAIYLNDTEMYPYFKYAIETALKNYRNYCDKQPNNKEKKSVLLEWEGRHNATTLGSRIEYLKYLKIREEDNMSFLRKKLGINL